jgi:PAS domain S-box-containing protein
MNVHSTPADVASDDNALFDLCPLPSLVFDDETLAILAVNRAAMERYGYSRDEFLALTFEDIRPSDGALRYRAAIDTQRLERGLAGLWRHQTKGGEVFTVDIVSQAVVYHGRAAHFFVVTHPGDRLALHDTVFHSP